MFRFPYAIGSAALAIAAAALSAAAPALAAEPNQDVMSQSATTPVMASQSPCDPGPACVEVRRSPDTWDNAWEGWEVDSGGPSILFDRR